VQKFVCFISQFSLYRCIWHLLEKKKRMCEIYCAEVEKLALLLYQEIKIETMCFGFSLSAATMFAAQSIQLGSNDIVVAGGMESMSNAPKYIAEARSVYCSSGCIRM
jgi:hypothetical protein